MTHKINIALYAHVDAGKTSVSELFLYHGGSIKQPGRVDKGNTQTDSWEVEKTRGITVNSVVSSIAWQGAEIHLIDTPGHLDFSAETELSLPIIDAAIVLVSAAEGVQAQTEQMVYWLKKYRKPFVVFVNKVDRIGVDIEAVLSDMAMELQLPILPMQQVKNAGSEAVVVKPCSLADAMAEHTPIMEQLLEADDAMMADYLDDKPLDFERIGDLLQAQVAAMQMVPVYFGAAKYDIGVQALLDGVCHYLMPGAAAIDLPLSAMVFKTAHHAKEGKWVALRLWQGRLQARDMLYNRRTATEEKARLLKDTRLPQGQIVQTAEAGDIVWVQGLSAAEAGDIIGDVPEGKEVLAPSPSFLVVQVVPQQAGQHKALLEALQCLHSENPALALEYVPETEEISVALRGQVQQEVLEAILLSRYGIAVHISPPSVLYKETVAAPCYGFVRYWMPKPCWAIMRFMIEPAPRGSGISFVSKVGVNDIKQRYQNDVRKALPQALAQGMLGWPVDDVRVTLLEGEDHVMHTKSNDFTIATPMGIMDALQHGQPLLLEPIFRFKIVAPEACLGGIVGELSQARAEMESPVVRHGQCRIKGEVPLATFLAFPLVLAKLSGGKAKLNSHFVRYATCEPALGSTRPYRGINPLDTAKYILKARKALQ